MWVGVADRERRRRLDDRIRERSSERPLWPSLDRSGEPRAGDVMTSDVCTIHYSDSVENAARAMVRRDCGALPVVNDSGRLIGMITDRDIVTRVVARGLDPRLARVDECMSDRVFACYEEDMIESCLWLMSRHQVRRIPWWTTATASSASSARPTWRVTPGPSRTRRAAGFRRRDVRRLRTDARAAPLD